jgi:hypothetical protein
MPSMAATEGFFAAKKWNKLIQCFSIAQNAIWFVNKEIDENQIPSIVSVMISIDIHPGFVRSISRGKG